MHRTSEHQNGILRVISRARVFNPEIGGYREHFMGDDFRYHVRLSNGRIYITSMTASDQELGDQYVSDDLIRGTANTFVSDEPVRLNPQKETAPAAEPAKKKLSLWQRILRALGF